MRYSGKLQRRVGKLLVDSGLRASDGQFLRGCLCGEFGAGGDVELGEDVGQVHLDGAGGDEQPPGDGLVPQAFADQADDLSFGRGQAGPASGGAFTSAAFAGGVGSMPGS